MKEDINESNCSTRKGREAIESLEKLIEEIEKGDLEDLTERQTAVMLRIARILIAAIDQETTVWESLKTSGSLAKLKQIMKKLIETGSKDNALHDEMASSVRKEEILFDLKARECIR